MSKADQDAVLYSASPSMFRGHPFAFCFWGLVGFILLVSSQLPDITSDTRKGLLAGSAAILAIYVIWWLRCRSTRLTVTTRKVSLRRGILGRSLNEVRLADVRNVTTRQSLLQRLFGVGAVGISTSGQSGVEIEVVGIPRPSKVREIIDGHRP